MNSDRHGSPTTDTDRARRPGGPPSLRIFSKQIEFRIKSESNRVELRNRFLDSNPTNREVFSNRRHQPCRVHNPGPRPATTQDSAWTAGRFRASSSVEHHLCVDGARLPPIELIPLPYTRKARPVGRGARGRVRSETRPIARPFPPSISHITEGRGTGIMPMRQRVRKVRGRRSSRTLLERLPAAARRDPARSVALRAAQAGEGGTSRGLPTPARKNQESTRRGRCAPHRCLLHRREDRILQCGPGRALNVHWHARAENREHAPPPMHKALLHNSGFISRLFSITHDRCGSG
jgi:hypothetical protein